jgi:hypothetical protein
MFDLARIKDKMYKPISSAQAKSVIDSEQLFSALRDAQRQLSETSGGMHWKTVSGKEYLYRTTDSKGNAKSLGPRSEKTEQILASFTERKKNLTELAEGLKEQLRTQEMINAAYRAGHVPNQVADICLQLDRAHLLDTNITIIGTNAMHVYEAMAGIRFPNDIMATVDIDLLWNHNSKLSLATTSQTEEAGLLGLLKKADRTFTIKSDQPFRAMAKSGYMVDLIRQMPNPPWADEPDRFFSDDLVATDIWNMKWLLGAPRVVQPVVAMDGRVFMMSAPDPRAFAMFKLWLSTSAEDREPEKKVRDAHQAEAVIRMIEERLPHLARAWPSLKSFPEDLMELTMEAVRRERERG